MPQAAWLSHKPLLSFMMQVTQGWSHVGLWQVTQSHATWVGDRQISHTERIGYRVYLGSIGNDIRVRGYGGGKKGRERMGDRKGEEERERKERGRSCCPISSIFKFKGSVYTLGGWTTAPFYSLVFMRDFCVKSM